MVYFPDIYNCPQTHTKCDNHFCVSRDKWCDFVDDCGDNSDEAICRKLIVGEKYN